MPPTPYVPPPWSAVPGVPYSLEVVREGAVIESIDISTKAHYVVGRDPSSADIVLPHPSVSRQHAIIQHRDTGEVYLFDNGSTHGSKLNRKPVPPHHLQVPHAQSRGSRQRPFRQASDWLFLWRLAPVGQTVRSWLGTSAV